MKHALPTLALALIPLAGCSGSKAVQSIPPVAPLAVDGDVADWSGSVQPVEGKDGIAMGITNEADAVYVSLIVRNPGYLRQITRTGLVLWLDADGGKSKTLGVRFPIGLAEERGMGMMPEARPSSREELGEAMRERFVASLDEMVVLRDGADEGARMPTAAPSGLSAAGTLAYGELVLEYRIPLGDGLGATLASTPGTRIGVGFVTPEIRRPDDGFGEGRDREMGGDRGRGAMGQGRGRERQRDASASMRAQASALSFWTQVDLAVR